MTTRIGAAIALVVAIAAAALAVAAFTATVRDESIKPGRLVSTRVNSDYLGEPLLFPVDDFYIGYDSAFEFRAFYLYPPGYYGHDRGCKVVWDGTAVIDLPSGPEGPGLYIDPCGGARFNKDGTLVDGPADRGLDYFGTGPGVDGVIVDTRRLLCGRTLSDATSATLTPEVTLTVSIDATATPTITLTPTTGAPVIGSPTVSVTAVETATSTSTLTPTATNTPATVVATATPARCERVTPNSKQR